MKGWIGCVKRALELESDKMSGLGDRRPFIYLKRQLSQRGLLQPRPRVTATPSQLSWALGTQPDAVTTIDKPPTSFSTELKLSTTLQSSSLNFPSHRPSELPPLSTAQPATRRLSCGAQLKVRERDDHTGTTFYRTPLPQSNIASP